MPILSQRSHLNILDKTDQRKPNSSNKEIIGCSVGGSQFVLFREHALISRSQIELYKPLTQQPILSLIILLKDTKKIPQVWITEYLSPHDLIDLCYTFRMNKEQFFKQLKALLKWRATSKSVPCRCSDCHAKRQSRPNTPASIS